VVVVPGRVGFEGLPGVTVEGARRDSAGKTFDSEGVVGLSAWSGLQVRSGWDPEVRSGLAWWLVPSSPSGQDKIVVQGWLPVQDSLGLHSPQRFSPDTPVAGVLT